MSFSDLLEPRKSSADLCKKLLETFPLPRKIPYSIIIRDINFQYMKYNAQSHHIKSPIYNALIQYSTMCKSTREKKSQALATPPLLSLVNYPQFSIHLYSFCILGTLQICTRYLYFQSICVFAVFYNLCLHCCSSLL